MTEQPAILVVGPSWVGDMMMAQSLFKVLKLEQPDVQIDVLAPTWSEGLLHRMPEIRRIISHTIEHRQLAWRERQRISWELRSYNYQQAIVLPNSWKSALIPFWAKIPRRTGYRGEMRYRLLNDMRPLNKFVLRRTVDQFGALGLPKNDPRIGQPIPNPRLLPGSVEPVLQRLKLEKNHNPILALCPGAEYGPAKQWPLEYYAEVAKQKLAEGWQVWLFGSNKDASLSKRIQTLAGEKGCINLCGQTSLLEAIDLLSIVDIVITNDSGLMHVVAALDKPLIAIYGSSNPSVTPPLSNQAHIKHLGLKCGPCYQRTCPKRHLKCLRKITPQQILEILKSSPKF